MSARLDRLLLVVPAARAQPGISVPELARTLACDPGELRADLDLLACVGAPPFQPDDLIDIEVLDDRVWVHLPQGFDRPTRLTATEAAALAIAAGALAPHDPVVTRAVEKLRRAVSPAQHAWYDAFVDQLATAPADLPTSIEAVLGQAIRERRSLTIDYYAPAERASRPRVVMPREIASADGVRYLSARREDGEERLYRLDRIRAATLRDESFASLPPIDLTAALAAASKFGVRADLPRATIRFDAAVAAAALARHPDASPAGDGAVSVELPYSTLPWLISYVLSWGGRALVVAPREAREALARAVDEALACVK